jgi:methylmalonyl-CoA mutase cobalamin-binding domain/chain
MEELEAGTPLDDLANQYLAALLTGDRHQATKLILDSFQQTNNLKQIYLHVFQPVLREIGRLWQINQVTVAQEHFSTATTQLIMAQFYPYLFTSPKNGRVLVATCVGGELHEVGMRMVADFFEMEAWDTYYLGANTPAESIVRALLDRKADILGVSATMTYHISAVQNLIRAVRSAEGCRGVKILVGGYPFNLAPDLWKDIGADGFAQNAVDAATMANKLLER